MIPFNLQEAKDGRAVCTRYGRDVTLIYFDKKSYNDRFKLIGLIKEGNVDQILTWDTNGKYFSEGDSMYDLFMKPIKYEGWIAVYHHDDHSNRLALVSQAVYKTKKEAEDSNFGAVDIIKIEWEK